MGKCMVGEESCPVPLSSLDPGVPLTGSGLSSSQAERGYSRRREEMDETDPNLYGITVTHQIQMGCREKKQSKESVCEMRGGEGEV